MTDRDNLIILYDYYGELLSDDNKCYFKDYYFNNYSLSEIAENKKLSRNAVHKHIKLIENKLRFYEDKLKLYQKDLMLKKEIDKIKDIVLKKKVEEIINIYL